MRVKVKTQKRADFRFYFRTQGPVPKKSPTRISARSTTLRKTLLVGSQLRFHGPEPGQRISDKALRNSADRS